MLKIMLWVIINSLLLCIGLNLNWKLVPRINIVSLSRCDCMLLTTACTTPHIVERNLSLISQFGLDDSRPLLVKSSNLELGQTIGQGIFLSLVSSF